MNEPAGTGGVESAQARMVRWPVERVLDERDLHDLEHPVEPIVRADGLTTRRKAAAGLRGLKLAVRGDSSFFAHFYRGTLLAVLASVLGVNATGWCVLVVAACLVLIAELAHSAVDALATAIGPANDLRLKSAREIADAGVLVAAIGAGILAVLVLQGKLVELITASL